MKGDLADMKLKYKNIILRDMEENDLDDYIRWNTSETEWKNLDVQFKFLFVYDYKHKKVLTRQKLYDRMIVTKVV